MSNIERAERAEESARWRLQGAKETIDYALRTLGTNNPDSQSVTGTIQALVTAVEWMGVARENRRKANDENES